MSDEYGLIAVQGPRSIERLGLPDAPAFTFAEAELDRHPVHGQPHRLHGRARRRAARDGRRRGRALGARARAWSDAVRARCAGHAAARGLLPAARLGHRPEHGCDLGRPRLGVRARQGLHRRRGRCAGSRRKARRSGSPRSSWTSRAVPRAGMAIVEGGRVTSGTHSPMLDCGIGMGYVPSAIAEPGEKITDRRARQAAARAHRPEAHLQARGVARGG